MIFLRHPKPEAPEGICYGQTDLDIGPEGEAQIALALKATPRIARVIASPARRCRRLAGALAARDGVGLVLDPRLWEMDFGDWEGMRWEDIPRADSDPWTEDPWRIAPPGGETFTAVHARVAAVIGEVIAEVAPGTAPVCHAGSIRMARIILTGAGFDEVCAEPVPYATPIRLTREAV